MAYSLTMPQWVRPPATNGGGAGLAAMEQFDAAFKGAQQAKFEEEAGPLLASLYGGQQAPLAALGGQQAAAPTSAPTPAAPVDYASQRVADAHGTASGVPDVGVMTAYIAKSAAQRGIDPSVAVRVARSEGLAPGVWQSNVMKDGKRERSYGPFQLYVDGGLGNAFQQQTGLDPADPKNWQQGVDFALDNAAKSGWGAWYGAGKAGISNFQGIRQGGGQAPSQAALESLAVGQSAQMPAAQPMQVADASGGFPAAPAAPAQQSSSLPDRETMLQLFANPVTRPYAIAYGKALQEARAGAADPMKQLQLQKAQLEIAKLRGSSAGEFKVVGDQLVRIGPDGQISDVTPGGQQPQNTGFRYTGKSVEAQALNGLIDAGRITPEQAQQLGAGKTITGPNGEIIFLTPQGVFGQTQGGPAKPLSPSPAGNITITEPKVTLDEKKAMTFADRMTTSNAIIDRMGTAGTGLGDRIASSLPVGSDYLTSDDFKAIDQAKRDFINAQLRRESGAVISAEEFDNANKQYFPQPNDTQVVLAQKQRNRQIVVDGMVRDGGPTYQRPKDMAAPALPQGVTEEDVRHTMQVHNLTREQVLERLNNAP